MTAAMSHAKASAEPVEPAAEIADADDAAGLTGADRRGSTRVLVDLEVDCQIEDNYLFAYISDISATGIFIKTLAPEPAGTLLNVRLDPRRSDDDDGGPPLVLEGVVIWVNPFRPGARDSLHPGMGVKFIGLDDVAQARLLHLVRRIAYL
jgi:uncharacterized protein (TIGR02266 family)